MVLITFLGVFVYDALWNSALKSNVRAATIVSFLLLAVAVYLFVNVGAFTPPAVLIHTGAMFGTMMAFNVWFRIWPAQQRIIAAVKAGEEDWWNQAERDLEHAVAARDGGRHEWACFAAHQAAEKAVKALHLARGQEAWGHVVSRLLSDLPAPVPEELVASGQVLDNFYVPSRYPNGHAEGAPFEHYGPIQSELGLRHARHILDFVRQALAER